jgi:hypothetical protein
MPESAAPNPQADASRLEAATDQAIAACGGNARDAVKALIVANEYLESEVCELTQAVSCLHARTVQNLLRLREGSSRSESHGRSDVLRCAAIRRQQ